MDATSPTSEPLMIGSPAPCAAECTVTPHIKAPAAAEEQSASKQRKVGKKASYKQMMREITAPMPKDEKESTIDMSHLGGGAFSKLDRI